MAGPTFSFSSSSFPPLPRTIFSTLRFNQVRKLHITVVGQHFARTPRFSFSATSSPKAPTLRPLILDTWCMADSKSRPPLCVSGFAKGAVRRGEVRRGEARRASALRQPCLRVYKLGSALGIFLLGQNWFFQPPPERSALPRSLPFIDPRSSTLATTCRSSISLLLRFYLSLFHSSSSFSSLFPDAVPVPSSSYLSRPLRLFCATGESQGDDG